MKPLCFVLMPFGKKPASGSQLVDFDAVYNDFIEPAVELAGMEPFRADEEMVGGIIHKPMFERLVLCEYAVADLTTANANVFYELGLRHAVRSWATQLLFAEGLGQLPFDVALLRALPYKLDANGKPENAEDSCKALTDRLLEAKKARTDSPVFQLLDGFPDIQRLKTDVFRERVEYAKNMKGKLAVARKQDVDAVRMVEQSLGDISQLETGVVVDLFLSYRATKAWDEMIALVERMPAPLKETVMVREQFGLALNRANRADEAEQVLLELIAQRGPSSETYGILGRVYKDQWESAFKAENSMLARGLLVKAIDAYLKGFEADWRDAYPGINAVTLMELKDPPDPRRNELLPVVSYAVGQRIKHGQPDYWDHATLLELAILKKNEEKASAAFADALASIRDPWEPETTARNLRLIREARDRRDEKVPWASKIEQELNKHGKA